MTVQELISMLSMYNPHSNVSAMYSGPGQQNGPTFSIDRMIHSASDESITLTNSAHGDQPMVEESPMIQDRTGEEQ